MAKGFNSRGYGPMGGMGGGMNMNMMKQVQKMQADMAKMQEELAAKTYTATTGGGVVTAEVNGQHELLSVTIDPEAVDPEDVEMLQDMVVAAVNEAMRMAEADAANSMKSITGGLGF
ncbi:MAG: YbaB/EbfC family nucleoid-associated protein [Oscillospiraceae bacterium]|nr:YbaB/EbfC family nucleoid-associated protein [Oscillospiraceae bacterium]